MIEEELKNPPAFYLPAGFAEKTAAKAFRMAKAKENLKDFLVIILSIAGLSGLSIACVLYLDYSLNMEFFRQVTAISRNFLYVGVFFLFSIFVDKVAMPFFLNGK